MNIYRNDMLMAKAAPAASPPIAESASARPIRPAALTPQLVEMWRGIQASSPELGSPFFAPEYIQALGEFLPEVEIAVIRQAGEVVGFFPYQRGRAGVGRPAGHQLSDFQGLIAPADLQLNPEALLRECGLAAWHFDHLPANQACFRRFHKSFAESPFVELSGGFEEYIAERRAAGSRWISQTQRKTRKMNRELGTVRLDLESRSEEIFQQLLRWKSLQRRRSQTFDVLQLAWVREFLQRVFATTGPHFSGILSTLHAGSRLVAAHFGVRSGGTLHIWFPGFELAAEKYSPGSIMFLEMFRAAEAAGIQRIDLGKGRERYKDSLQTGSVTLAEGCADFRRFGSWFSGAWYAGRGWLRDRPLLHRTLQIPKRKLRSVLQRLRHLP